MNQHELGEPRSRRVGEPEQPRLTRLWAAETMQESSAFLRDSRFLYVCMTFRKMMLVNGSCSHDVT